MDSFKGEDGKLRCGWCYGDTLYVEYHDHEWGRVVQGDNAIFERISLEGFQAGLNWLMILKRREHFRSRFMNFEIEKVSEMNDEHVESLMSDPQVIRNRRKIISVIENARVIKSSKISISDLVWSFQPTDANSDYQRATSPESENLSKELKKIGLSFVGPTMMYAMMQSIGMVNDHHPECFLK